MRTARLSTLLGALLFPALALAAGPAAKPHAKPAAKPHAKPAARPATRPHAKPATKAAPAHHPAASTAALPPMYAPKLPVVRAKLDNGLRVVMSPDHTSPTVAVDVVYDVGSRNEKRGHSGFAHLFEHMMFQGSKNVARGEHFKLVTSHGGTLNGSTSEDRTNYYEMLPQSELALALWLEADRMKSLDISQSNFENQRKVVEEEFRMRVSNAPYVPAELRLQSMVYQGYWPYEHPAIGTMADLDAAQLQWVRAFHDEYYAPNDAVLSIAGDFQPDECMKLVTKYFGAAKPQPKVPPFEPGALPAQTAPRDATVEDAHAKLAAILLGWAIPPTHTPDHYALAMLGMLLADGESSRLYQKLVRERAIAQDVDAGTDDLRGPDYLEISAKVASHATVAQVQKAIDAEIARVQRTPPTAKEMEKLRTRLEAHFLFGLQSNFARAQQLARFELYWGDADLLNDEIARYSAVTAEDIRRVAAKYLTPERRSRVEVKPGAQAPAVATKKKGGH